MREFSLTFDIDAPPDRVWAVMRDVEHWPEWTPTVTSVRPEKNGPFAVGSHYIIRQPKLPPAKWRLTELDETARRFTWVNAGPGVTTHAQHWVEDLGGLSRVTLSIRFTGLLAGLVARLTAKLNDEYLSLEAKGLKARSEATSV